MNHCMTLTSPAEMPNRIGMDFIRPLLYKLFPNVFRIAATKTVAPIHFNQKSGVNTNGWKARGRSADAYAFSTFGCGGRISLTASGSGAIFGVAGTSARITFSGSTSITAVGFGD